MIWTDLTWGHGTMGNVEDGRTPQKVHGLGDPGPTKPLSPLRALIPIVPLLVILTFGSNLLGLWSTPGQHAARIERQDAAMRQQEEQTRRNEAARERAGRPEPPPSGPDGQPARERSVEPQDWLKDAMARLERLRQQQEEPLARGPLPAPRPAEPVPERNGGGEMPIPFDPAFVVAMLPQADVENGARSFRMCRACHANEKGASSFIGPNLWDIVGRPKAKARDFQYSPVLAGMGGVWTHEDLAAFLHSPRAFAPGTKMAFAGVPDPKRIADLIAYLSTLTDAGRRGLGEDAFGADRLRGR